MKSKKKYVIQEYIRNTEYLNNDFNNLNINPAYISLVKEINHLVLVDSPILHEISDFFSRKKFTVPDVEILISNLEKFLILMMELSEIADQIFPNYRGSIFSKSLVTNLIGKFDIVGEVSGSSSDDSSHVSLHYSHKKKVYYLSEKEFHKLVKTFRTLFPHSPDTDDIGPGYERQARDLFRYLQYIEKNYQWNQLYPEKPVILGEFISLLKPFITAFDLYTNMFQHGFHTKKIRSYIQYFNNNFIEWERRPGKNFKLYNFLDEPKLDYRKMIKFFESLKKGKIIKFD